MADAGEPPEACMPAYSVEDDYQHPRLSSDLGTHNCGMFIPTLTHVKT